jgi:hypothetical protein
MVARACAPCVTTTTTMTTTTTAAAAATTAMMLVQGDAYAPPSKFGVIVGPELAAVPAGCYNTHARRVAAGDFFARAFFRISSAAGALEGFSGASARGSFHAAKGGGVTVERPSQHVLERTSVFVHPDGAVECRFAVALPAQGRTVLGQQAAEILTRRIPALAARALVVCGGGAGSDGVSADALLKHVNHVDAQQHLRDVRCVALRCVACVRACVRACVCARVRGVLHGCCLSLTVL